MSPPTTMVDTWPPRILPYSFLDMIPVSTPAATLHPHPFTKIPTEIWRMIFTLATVIPRGYDSSLSSPFDPADTASSSSPFLNRLSENHRTKLTICLVCRKWRAIAQELLFEYIFLQEGIDWNLLAEGLEESQSVDEGLGGRGAGWYVKRLEVYSSACTPELVSAAARVIRCCPNLHTLTVALMGEDEIDTPKEVISAIFQSACAKSLRCLEWSSDSGQETTSVLTSLPLAANLQYLFCCISGERHTPTESVYGLTMPRLHTLEIVSIEEDSCGVLVAMTTWNMPSLRRVIYTSLTGVAPFAPFFEKHGRNISMLELDTRGEASHTFLRLCPNLEELVLDVHSVRLQQLPLHSSIKRIGLRGFNFNSPRSDNHIHILFTALDASLCRILARKRFPALKVVRLLDFDQLNLRSQTWRTMDAFTWAIWVWRSSRLNIKFEDQDGRLIAVHCRKIGVKLPHNTITDTS